MGLFRPYQSNDAAASQGQIYDSTDPDFAVSGGKGSPTLSRREAERLRRERLNPTLSKKERKARERAVARARQDDAYAKVESSPERLLLRNYIDSKWTLSEFSWPVLMMSMAAVLAGTWFPTFGYFASFAIWAILLVIVLEVTIYWFRFKRLLAERHPGASRRGLLMYMTSRMVSMRRYRRPPTAINRGDAF